MIQFDSTVIKSIAFHFVGNKHDDEMVRYTKTLVNLDFDLAELLLHYFLQFKSNEQFHFYHDTDMSMNIVYACVSTIFNDPDTLFEESKNLAKHLYEQSIHPKIKGGEFYTVYFKDCVIDGETTDAVGLFKSENKDTFLKIVQSNGDSGIEGEEGININKLDKGCLIFNKEQENGYVVMVVDNTNKGMEAQYWIDEFLHIRQRKDEYYNTQNVLSLAKHFIKEELPQQFEVSKADQVDLLNKSVKFFKENDNFDIEDFTTEVIAQPEVIESFNQYKKTFEEDYDVEIADNFAISDSAVRKQARVFKSVIKLDKNFHIYVHGNRNLIEQGEDTKGKFYKVYYTEEN